MEQRDFLSPVSNQNMQQNLPNSTASLVLGILSILGTLCYGIGLICGIVGLVLAAKDRRLYREAPELYSPSSYGTTNAGRICSIIGVVLSSLAILVFLMFMIFFSTFSQVFR